MAYGVIRPRRAVAGAWGSLGAALTLALATPGVAWAAGDGTPVFSTMLDNVVGLVNTVVLPIALVTAAWKIIYLVIFPGLMGSDPFNQVPDGYSLQWDAIWTLVKLRFTGVFKGVMWVAGIWLAFNLVISVVSVLARNLDAVF